MKAKDPCCSRSAAAGTACGAGPGRPHCGAAPAWASTSESTVPLGRGVECRAACEPCRMRTSSKTRERRASNLGRHHGRILARRWHPGGGSLRHHWTIHRDGTGHLRRPHRAGRTLPGLPLGGLCRGACDGHVRTIDGASEQRAGSPADLVWLRLGCRGCTGCAATGPRRPVGIPGQIVVAREVHQ